MLIWFLVRWAGNVVALWVAAELLSGVEVVDDELLTYIAAGFVFSAVNMLVKPFVALISLPLIVMSLGLAYFLINVLMLFLTSWLVDDFHIDGFWDGVAAAIVVWLVNMLLGAFGLRGQSPASKAASAG